VKFGWGDFDDGPMIGGKGARFRDAQNVWCVAHLRRVGNMIADNGARREAHGEFTYD
jgi:hypothetical protein